MTKLERVNKGLQCIIDGSVEYHTCDYAIDRHRHGGCHEWCAKEAMELLNEEKPKEEKAWWE